MKCNCLTNFHSKDPKWPCWNFKQLTLSRLCGLTFTCTPTSWVSLSSILLYAALSVSTRMSPFWRRLTDLSVQICALKALSRTNGDSIVRGWSCSAASITNHLWKIIDMLSLSVSESSDPGDDLSAHWRCFWFLVVMFCGESFDSLAPHPPQSSNKRREGPSTWHPDGWYETAIALWLGRCRWVTRN